MYDFTAPHVIEAVRSAARPSGRKISLVLQRGQDIGKGTKANDVPEEETITRLAQELKKKFQFAWASVRFKGALFKSSYHIKVAVRDGKAFWLSSGNWQSSNQPDHDPLRGRRHLPVAALEPQSRVARGDREREAVHRLRALPRARPDQAIAHPAPEEAVLEMERMVWVDEDYFQPTEAELEARPQFTSRPLP